MRIIEELWPVESSRIIHDRLRVQADTASIAGDRFETESGKQQIVAVGLEGAEFEPLYLFTVITSDKLHEADILRQSGASALSKLLQFLWVVGSNHQGSVGRG